MNKEEIEKNDVNAQGKSLIIYKIATKQERKFDKHLIDF